MKILIIGAGKMGQAILSSWLSKKFNFKISITVVEIDYKKIKSLKLRFPKISISNEIPMKWKGNLILISIKPQAFLNISKNFNEKAISTNILISIMAGIKLDKLQKYININTIYIRAMPNLASLIGKGVTGMFSKKSINKKNKVIIEDLFLSLGKVYWLKSEKLFDPLTAISGSGPAYYFLFFLTMINAAKKFGFSNRVSKEIVLNTAEGAIEVFKDKGNLEKLILDVASPGGTTEAALKILSKGKPNLITILNKAILEANDRSKNLGENAT